MGIQKIWQSATEVQQGLNKKPIEPSKFVQDKFLVIRVMFARPGRVSWQNTGPMMTLSHHLWPKSYLCFLQILYFGLRSQWRKEDISGPQKKNRTRGLV